MSVAAGRIYYIYTDVVYIAACAVPARCLGWSVNDAVSVCAPGYRAGSPGCAACDDGYYPLPGGSGECGVCPDTSKPWSIIQPLLVFIGSILAVGAATFVLIYLVSKRYGGSISGGARRSAQFMIWLFTVVQVRNANYLLTPHLMELCFRWWYKLAKRRVQGCPASFSPFIRVSLRTSAINYTLCYGSLNPLQRWTCSNSKASA